jgi:energy-coupling factor transport system permease protein
MAVKTFVFSEDESFLHRLNPLTKLLLATIVMIGLTVIVDPITPLVLLTLTLLAIALLGQVNLGALLRLLLPVVVLSFSIIWTTALFYVVDPTSHPRTLLQIGPLAFTDQAVAYGLTIMFRMLGFFGASLLFILTTDPTDFVQALIQKLGLSPRFGYGAHSAYGFVPLLESELSMIRAAHRVRGVKEGGSPAAWYRYYVGLLVPLLAGSVRRAERVALAMDARAFGAAPTRTYYRQSTFGREDLLFAVGAVIVLGGSLFVLHSLGWLGQLVPPFLT